jgi:TP901 family phage tail tape measure protein
MAVPDIQKIVKIVFAGDDTSLGKTINSVGGGMDALGVKLKGATQPLADFSDAVLKIDVVLAGIAAGALVVATTAAGTFGDSFREITTLIDAPAEAMDEFRTNVLNYSRDSGSSIEDVSGALYSIISATSDWENSLDALTATERLNIAGKGELADTSKLLSTALNAYGAAAADAGDYSDVLFTAVRVGVTTLPELSAGLGSITALANSAGVPFDDLAASVAALTGSTGDTSLSVTQLKGILTAILGPGKAARDMAESLEIAFDREALAAEGLQGFLQKVFAATGGNSEQMKVLFGRVEALTGALILGEDASGKFATAMQAMEERTGVVDKAYEKMADGFGLNNQRIINSLRVTLIDVGTPLLDEWGELAGGLANIFEGVSVGIDAGAFDPVINFIEGVAGDLSELFEGIGLALPDALADVDWSGFTDSLEGLLDIGKDILKDLFGDLDLKNAKDLGDAIQIVVNLLDRWMVLTGGIIDNLRPIIAVVGDMVAKFAEADKETVKIVGSIAAWGKTVNLVAGFVPNLTGPLTLLAAGFNLMALTRIPAMMSGLSGMLPALGGVGAALGVAAKGAVAFGLGWTIGTVLREHVPIIKEMGDNLGEAAFNLVHLGDNSVTAMERQAAHTKEMGDAAVAAALLSMKLKEITPGEAIEIDLALEDFFSDIDLATEYLQKELTPKQLVEIDFALDEFFKDIDTVQQKFEYIFFFLHTES